MIGGRKINGELQECPEGVTIVDLSFQLGIGIDTEPLLEQETFEQDKRRISFISFKTIADGIVFEKDLFDGLPIDGSINFFHSFDGSIAIAGVRKSNVGKSQIGIDFFEAHSSSRLVDLKELWQKN
jgi:hypothetical protein